ncbi:hypothetical protein GQ607_009337 [Colletotrichum asianum]|uniref:Uncharacterized protein n=1 Tax=Colletotrichum asianum TaxID=702518 RepID=A0A8H3ZTZ7_9PEZI|nr:hypothetical protein GQ607_009337 [Colletotrichum asianum]
MLRCFWPLVAWTSSHRIALCDNDDEADDDADKDNERSSSVSEKLGAILTPTPPVALLLIVLVYVAEGITVAGSATKHRLGRLG